MALSNDEREAMTNAFSGMICFVIIAISLLYGTRIAWACGKNCKLTEAAENKKQAIFNSIPAATLVYFLGFLIVFNLFLSGFSTVFLSSLTSALLLAVFVVSMTMPELRRTPNTG